MGSTWGNYLKLSIFGESHGKAIGVTLDGFPAGVVLSEEEIQREMARRAGHHPSERGGYPHSALRRFRERDHRGAHLRHDREHQHSQQGL